MGNDKNGTSKETMQRKVQTRVFSLKEKKIHFFFYNTVLSLTLLLHDTAG